MCFIFEFSYFRNHYADYYTQLCLDSMHGETIDKKNTLVTLVDSVVEPNYPVTLSIEHYPFCREFQAVEFVFLVTRLVR